MRCPLAEDRAWRGDWKRITNASSKNFHVRISAMVMYLVHRMGMAYSRGLVLIPEGI